MIVELEFFGDKENSRKGTLSALITMAMLVITDFLIFIDYKNIDYKNFVIYFIIITLYGSSVGVAKPSSDLDAFVYGFMVGFVMSSVMALVGYTITNNKRFMIYTIYTPFVTGLSCYTIYKTGVRN